MSEHPVLSTVVQCNVVKTNENVQLSEIFQRLCTQFENEALSKTEILCMAKFLSSDYIWNNYKIWAVSHQPKISIMPENICKVLDLMEGNQRVTLDEIN